LITNLQEKIDKLNLYLKKIDTNKSIS